MYKKVVAMLLGLQVLAFPALAVTQTYKICGLPDAGAVLDTDHIELSRSCNGSYNATGAELATYFLGKAPGSNNQIIYNLNGKFAAGPASTIVPLLGLPTVATSGSYADLANKPALGTASGYAAAAFAQAANNLSDLASPSTALTNLGFSTLGKNLAALPSLPAAGLVVGNGSAAPTALTGTVPGQVPTWNGSGFGMSAPGNVTGPTVSTDRTLPRISGTTGTALKASNIAVSDNDEISGYRQLVLPDATAARTLAAADRGATLRFTGAAAITVTLPNSLPLGFSVEIVQDGGGQVSFATAAGATLTNAHAQTKTSGQYAAVRLLVTQNTDGVSASYNLAGDTGQ